MDWELLLKKYMTLVAYEESITFLNRLEKDGTSFMFTTDPFTPEEMTELQRIASEID